MTTDDKDEDTSEAARRGASSRTEETWIQQRLHHGCRRRAEEKRYDETTMKALPRCMALRHNDDRTHEKKRVVLDKVIVV